ncbi:hypothetical protein G7Y79_00032g066610 [Physcia stellaris]|nr:hypothetical protein G7Y79_00032g066610 [Physcia stellaris]
MGGLAKQRAKKDRQALRDSNNAQQALSVEQTLRAYDGPGESSRETFDLSAGGFQGRERAEFTASLSTDVRSPSRGRDPSQIRETSTKLLPDRSALMKAARLLGLPGNAYQLGNEAPSFIIVLSV